MDGRDGRDGGWNKSVTVGSRAAGFTLVEMTVVIGLLGILVAMGMPGFGDRLQRQRTQGTMHLLSADLALARNTAVMRSKPVVVCPRTTVGACADSSDWSLGWLVFTDDDGDRRPDTLADIVRSEDAPGGPEALQVLSTRPSLRYQPDGRSAHSNLTVNICSARAIRGQVIVNNTGRVRTSYANAGLPCPA